MHHKLSFKTKAYHNIINNQSQHVKQNELQQFISLYT